ncbi:MAG: ATP-binding protein [Methanomassiliicoccaceae archaeon]|nr:ATP-binding protein [Methanomassiliicoccaceae archaeon]
MKRTICKDLLKWKNSDDRKPLLLQGVRQCGKTYILKEFGKKNYDDVAYFTFERNPILHDLFRTDLDPKRLVEGLGLMRGKKIEPGRTLLILDEIQFCNRALTSLKFFCEDAPEYHVACAGSLLGVMLSKPYSFPVGKVDRLKMYPLTFKEFLLANSEDLVVEYIDANYPAAAIPAPVADKLTTYLNQYFLIGGMPAAVASWITKKDIRKIDVILDTIIKDYADDFAKHAFESLTKLTLIWSSIPVQLARENKKFVFGHVKAGARSKDLEDALEWLVDAGLVYKVKKLSEPKMPLSMFVDNTSFKVYMADIGTLRRMSGVPSDFIFSADKEYDEFKGAIMENYVLSELISSTGNVPYYWRSDATAEVDFVTQIDGKAIPVEAKAGKNKSKSLVEYVIRYRPDAAVTTTPRRNVDGTIRHIPPYLIWKIESRVAGDGPSLRTMPSGTE